MVVSGSNTIIIVMMIKVVLAINTHEHKLSHIYTKEKENNRNNNV